jgi:hypothetical protein
VRAIDWVTRDFGPRPWEKWDSQLVAEWRREIDIPENALMQAVHLRTDPLENDPDDDDFSSVDAADLLPNLGKAMPPWPLTLVTWRRGIGRSRAELYAALVISQRGPDGRFAVLALCFQDWGHDDLEDYQSAEAVLLHFDENGVWDAARDAWLENGAVHARKHHPQTPPPEFNADEMLYRHLLVRIGAHNADEPGHFEQLLRRLLAGDRELAEEVLIDANRTIDSPNPGSSYLGSSCESCDEYRIHLPSSVTFDTGNSMYGPIWKAFALSNCRNMKLVAHQIPKRRQHVYRNRGLPVVERYYTLQIDWNMTPPPPARWPKYGAKLSRGLLFDQFDGQFYRPPNARDFSRLAGRRSHRFLS